MKNLSGMLLGGLLLGCSALTAAGALNIIDYYSPRNRERPRRTSTRYIILHTTEGATKGSLDKVRRYGECHYFVNTAGKVYRIVHHRRIALHAGRSMWQGKTNIDRDSIGIEVTGYHNKDLTSAQYKAVKELLMELQRMYNIPDERVLTHSMVAYGAPNRWHKSSHRGRKRCGMQFAKWSVRQKLGLTRQPKYDPDVKAGRLLDADPYLSRVLYGSAHEQEKAAQRFSAEDANVIASGRSAWDIARDKYKSSDVVYVFPSGKRYRGNEIRDWKSIPAGTRVLRTAAQSENAEDDVKELGVDGETAWDLAGEEYAGSNTIYFLPDGKIRAGSEIPKARLDALPRGTKILVGYTYGGHITANRRAFDICGARWNFPTTFYRLPDGKMVRGSSISEKAIPRNTRIYYQN